MSSATAPSAAAAAAAPNDVDVSDIGGISVYHNYEHHLQSIAPTSSFPEPFLLRTWLEQHASAADSKAGKRGFVYQRDAQFHLQVHTGPSPLSAEALHVQSGEEWIYVLSGGSGGARVRVVDGRTVREHHLGEGSCFLVPGGVPKSLTLTEGCIALVMTRERKTDATYPHFNKTHTVAHLTHLNNNGSEPLDEPDQLIWLCTKCGDVAHAQQFQCTDICQYYILLYANTVVFLLFLLILCGFGLLTCLSFSRWTNCLNCL